jgi:hypothetical protein
MKNFLWMVSGVCFAAFGMILWGPQRTRPIHELAHRLEEAWADHHTVA